MLSKTKIDQQTLSISSKANYWYLFVYEAYERLFPTTSLFPETIYYNNEYTCSI